MQGLVGRDNFQAPDMIRGGFPIETNTKIIYLIICCYHKIKL